MHIQTRDTGLQAHQCNAFAVGRSWRFDEADRAMPENVTKVTPANARSGTFSA
jgi:hypothetical protein